MPHKFRLYQRKNAERKKREKSSSSTVSSESSSSEQLSSDVSSEVSSALQTPSPATEQTQVQAASNSGLHALHSSIVLPDSWSDQSPDGLENILLCRISNQASSGTMSLRITHCLKISDDLSWSLFVNQHCIDPSKCGALKSFPTKMNSGILSQLLTKWDDLLICIGQPDAHFVKMVAAKKGKIISPSGKVAAYVYSDTCTKTVRTTECELVCPSAKCESCKAYRSNLKSIYNRWSM